MADEWVPSGGAIVDESAPSRAADATPEWTPSGGTIVEHPPAAPSTTPETDKAAAEAVDLYHIQIPPSFWEKTKKQLVPAAQAAGELIKQEAAALVKPRSQAQYGWTGTAGVPPWWAITDMARRYVGLAKAAQMQFQAPPPSEQITGISIPAAEAPEEKRRAIATAISPEFPAAQILSGQVPADPKTRWMAGIQLGAEALQSIPALRWYAPLFRGAPAAPKVPFSFPKPVGAEVPPVEAPPVQVRPEAPPVEPQPVAAAAPEVPLTDAERRDAAEDRMGIYGIDTKPILGAATPKGETLTHGEAADALEAHEETLPVGDRQASIASGRTIAEVKVERGIRNRVKQDLDTQELALQEERGIGVLSEPPKIYVEPLPEGGYRVRVAPREQMIQMPDEFRGKVRVKGATERRTLPGLDLYLEEKGGELQPYADRPYTTPSKVPAVERQPAVAPTEGEVPTRDTRDALAKERERTAAPPQEPVPAAERPVAGAPQEPAAPRYLIKDVREGNVLKGVVVVDPNTGAEMGRFVSGERHPTVGELIDLRADAQQRVEQLGRELAKAARDQAEGEAGKRAEERTVTSGFTAPLSRVSENLPAAARPALRVMAKIKQRLPNATAEELEALTRLEMQRLRETPAPQPPRPPGEPGIEIGPTKPRPKTEPDIEEDPEEPFSTKDNFKKVRDGLYRYKHTPEGEPALTVRRNAEGNWDVHSPEGDLIDTFKGGTHDGRKNAMLSYQDGWVTPQTRPEPRPVWPATTPPPMTRQMVMQDTIDKAFKKLRDSGETNTDDPALGLSFAEMVRGGHDAMHAGVDPEAAFRSNNIRPDLKYAVVRAHGEDLRNEASRLHDIAEAQPTRENNEAAEAAFRDFSNWNGGRVLPSRREASDFLVGKGELPVEGDMNIRNMVDLREQFIRTNNRNIRPEEMAKAKKIMAAMEKTSLGNKDRMDSRSEELAGQAPHPKYDYRDPEQLRQLMNDIMEGNSPCV